MKIGIHFWQKGRFLAIVILFALLSGHVVWAQDGVVQPRLVTVSAVGVDRLPAIELRLWGIDTIGNPLDFDRFVPQITHASMEIATSDIIRTENVGTFTLVLVDTPPGVKSELPALEEALKLYLDRGEMQEQTDFIALYQVGTQGGIELLAPTTFHNSVLNALVEPFPAQNGPTALVDSVGGLLEQIDELRPSEHLATAMVVFSDGTDVVSNRFNREAIAGLAAAQGIPIHTVALNNENLRDPTAGQSYLADLAVGTGGTAADLTEQGVMTIWERISRLRTHTVIRYIVPELTAGDIPVAIRFGSDGSVQTGTQIAITGSTPFVELTVPENERQLTLPNVDTAVPLSFPADVNWLDGTEREITQALLWVNGVQAATVDPDLIDRFEAEIPLRFGRNEVWLSVADIDAQQRNSPILYLDVLEGVETVIPPTLQVAESGRLWIFVFGGFSVLLLLIGFMLWLWQQPELWEQLFGGVTSARGRRVNRELTPPSLSDVGELGRYGETTKVATPVIAGYALDVIESVTRSESPLTLRGIEVRVGRSPASSDLVFENDITLSRLHATFIQEDQSYRLYDEGSTSGTFVNLEPVPEYGRLLVDGDEVSLGAVRLYFRVVYDMTEASKI